MRETENIRSQLLERSLRAGGEEADKYKLPAKRPSQLASYWIADGYRTYILTSRLKPGDALPESRVAQANGVSQSVARDGVFLLNETGLVTRSSGQSARVTELNEVQIFDRIAMRIPLETLAFTDAAVSLSEADSVWLEAKAKAMSEKMTMLEDFEWHEALWKLSKNEGLHDELVRIAGPLFIQLSADRETPYDPTTEEWKAMGKIHLALLKGIRGRNRGEILKSVVYHILESFTCRKYGDTEQAFRKHIETHYPQVVSDKRWTAPVRQP